MCDKPIPEKCVAFGEVGLGGEIRSVSRVHERVKEAARLGFEKCIVPKNSFRTLSKNEDYGIKIIGADTLAGAFRAIAEKKENK